MCGLAAAFGLSSCSDFLDIEPRNLVILEQFWNEKTDVDNTVAGCYEGLQSTANITRMMAWGEFRSDNISIGEKAEQDDYHMYKFLQANIDPNNVYTDWSSFYSVINRCNTVIFYAPQVQQKDPSFSESDLRATIAEVSAIRDLCYFYLIRSFKNVPYITTAYTDDNQPMAIPASPFEEVLDSLINDLERVKGDAVRRYPTNGDKQYYQTGRITRDAIYAMLCEMYLWKQDYQKCIDYADLIIKSKQDKAKEDEGTLYSNMDKYFDGYPLIANWTSQTGYFGAASDAIFASGNSDESIFELYFSKTNANMSSNGAVNAYYGYLDGSWYYRVSPSQYLVTDVSNNLFKLFRNQYDARYYESIYSSNIIGKYTASITPVIETTSTKVSTLPSTLYAKDKNRANWIIYRLTDIMLMKAEALVQLAAGNDDEKLQEAFKLVQVVNKRSILKDKDRIAAADMLSFPTEDAKTKMEEMVMQERQRELLFEGKRWFDLVRRSMRDGNNEYLSRQISNKGLMNAAIVTSNFETTFDAIFLPAYLEEWKVNKNVWVNPAYTYEEKD
ncbi:MAG: RagB/SusD family nutrient uptake outer membrane protein [Prevotella sp.]|nr:RagB/SusD family nutrient uptake outer membrane protein [Prevotella sp.]